MGVGGLGAHESAPPPPPRQKVGGDAPGISGEVIAISKGKYGTELEPRDSYVEQKWI